MYFSVQKPVATARNRSLIFSKYRQPQPKPNAASPRGQPIYRLPSVQSGSVPVFFPVQQPDFRTLNVIKLMPAPSDPIPGRHPQPPPPPKIINGEKNGL